jgi:hypothetical protein
VVVVDVDVVVVDVDVVVVVDVDAVVVVGGIDRVVEEAPSTGSAAPPQPPVNAIIDKMATHRFTTTPGSSGVTVSTVPRTPKSVVG